MGKLIQCNSRLAKKPYYFRMTDTNVYSIEEVCYYIRHNIYMMQEEIFNHDFAVWLREELDMDETAKKMENMIYDNNNLKDIVVTLCCSCDYYDEAEINELIRIMDETANLPLRKRQKIKADNFLKCHSYEKAIEEYEHILKSDDMLMANIEEYGSIYHNMGVCLAGLGDFLKASESFSNAYEKSRSEESLREYIYCILLLGDEEKYKLICTHYDISEETLGKIKQDFEEINIQSGKSKDVGRISRLKDILKSGYMDEYYDKVGNYIREWKNEYRNEISV